MKLSIVIYIFVWKNLLPWINAIYGGETVFDPHEFAWMARLNIYIHDGTKVVNCGGTIISKNVVGKATL